MRSRINQRARTDFRVRTRAGVVVSDCRAIEVSATGVLLDRGRTIRPEDERLFLELEMHLPERRTPFRVIARPIWSFGTQQALKFVQSSDADRLELAEHVDRLVQQGRPVA